MTTISIMTIALWVFKLSIAVGIISLGVRILLKIFKKLFGTFKNFMEED